MTGRRLYDHFCDSLGEMRYYGNPTRNALPETPIAWTFLSQHDRDTWNKLARRITPRKRKP